MIANTTFLSIDEALLGLVTGGAESAGNSQKETVGVPVPGTPPIIDKSGTRTDYGYCLDNARQMSLNVADTVTMCGKPTPAP